MQTNEDHIIPKYMCEGKEKLQDILVLAEIRISEKHQNPLIAYTQFWRLCSVTCVPTFLHPRRPQRIVGELLAKTLKK